MKLGIYRTKRDSRLCKACGQHRAVHKRPADSRMQTDRDHELCQRCFRSVCTSAKFSKREFHAGASL